MARNFTPHTQIVLGYSGYERGKGWLHKRISFDALFTSLRYLGFALAGKPYMGLGRNLAYRKEMVFQRKRILYPPESATGAKTICSLTRLRLLTIHG